AVITAVGLVPQLLGIPIVGAVVCVERKCALVEASVANAVSVPVTTIFMPDESAVNNEIPALFWIWKASVTSVGGFTITLPALPVPDEAPPCSNRSPPSLLPGPPPPACNVKVPPIPEAAVVILHVADDPDVNVSAPLPVL